MSISKVNFQVYADGKRRILVVENCVGEMLDTFNQILEAVCGLPENGVKAVPAVLSDTTTAAPPEVKKGTEVQNFGFIASVSSEQSSLHEAKWSFPDVIFITGHYAGMTPSEAVEKDGIRAIAELCECSRDLESETVRKQVIECCKHVISTDLDGRPKEMDSVEELKDFFASYRRLLGSKCLRELRDTVGIDLDEAIREENAVAMSKAYRTVLSDLRIRTTI